ncbi:hypothetical protein GQ53DRAFT_783880 [Thozetella sp. PMI_491]|nr:hypothetical protein GQ53DRAFT_783880 [Thozetella sp. PMI_491]
MPSISMPSKIAATKSYGATVHFSGLTSFERLAGYGNIFMSPYHHPDLLLGPGTPGAPSPRVASCYYDTVWRGGMLSGVALSCVGTGITVFGSMPSFEGANDCRHGLAAGKRVKTVKSRSIADGPHTPVGEIPWTVISNPEYVNDVFAVTEDQISDALELVLQRMKLLIETSSAVPLAVALYNEDFRRILVIDSGLEKAAFNLMLVISGGNFDVRRLPELLRQM